MKELHYILDKVKRDVPDFCWRVSLGASKTEFLEMFFRDGCGVIIDTEAIPEYCLRDFLHNRILELTKAEAIRRQNEVDNMRSGVGDSRRGCRGII